MSNSVSEQFLAASLEWVELDAAARLLEKTEPIQLAQLAEAIIAKEGGSHAAAERRVKASPGWRRDVENTVHARTRANKAKVQAKYLEMKYFERAGDEATKRVEMRTLDH